MTFLLIFFPKMLSEDIKIPFKSDLRYDKNLKATLSILQLYVLRERGPDETAYWRKRF